VGHLITLTVAGAPIGIGESPRRLCCMCLARQRRGRWDHLLTNPMPEHVAERDAAIADAAADHRTATAHLEATNATLLPLGSADAAAARRAVADAQAALDNANKPVNYPVNRCFSPDGCPLVALEVQSWVETRPDGARPLRR